MKDGNHVDQTEEPAKESILDQSSIIESENSIELSAGGTVQPRVPGITAAPSTLCVVTFELIQGDN